MAADAGYQADPHLCRLLAGWPEQEVPTYKCESCGQRMHGYPAMIEHRHVSIARQQEAEIERLRGIVSDALGWSEGRCRDILRHAFLDTRNDSQEEPNGADAGYGAAFPIQGERHERIRLPAARVPREVAEIAYSDYARQNGRSQSLDRLGERGGFGWIEFVCHAAREVLLRRPELQATFRLVPVDSYSRRARIDRNE